MLNAAANYTCVGFRSIPSLQIYPDQSEQTLGPEWSPEMSGSVLSERVVYLRRKDKAEKVTVFNAKIPIK